MSKPNDINLLNTGTYPLVFHRLYQMCDIALMSSKPGPVAHEHQSEIRLIYWGFLYPNLNRKKNKGDAGNLEWGSFKKRK